PVQVSADGMETDRLKQRFGNKLSFWGAMDTTEILPNGTVDDVRNEVRKIIRDLAPAGGFVLASVHNLQPDIPPENIIAMFEAASQYGKYPIPLSGADAFLR
ncbi:MAG: uroporphyrinogen decarboxylase, partial [Desulfobacterales bacterium]|nr:uroporphyrinogen decarboxylase [Desulfobacterales bacterium]